MLRPPACWGRHVDRDLRRRPRRPTFARRLDRWNPTAPTGRSVGTPRTPRPTRRPRPNNRGGGRAGKHHAVTLPLPAAEDAPGPIAASSWDPAPPRVGP